MWFPTQSKLDAALKSLIAKMAQPLLGAEDALKESRAFDSVLGPSIAHEQFFVKGERIGEALLNLLHGLRSGGASVNEVNTRLPAARAMVEQYQVQFQAFTVARNAGADEANKFFEGGNAKN